jgi:uncharacterized protein DUF3151
VTSHPSQRPLTGVPIAGGALPQPAAPRHETVLPDEPDDAVAALTAALRLDNPQARREAVARVAAADPAYLDAWARLSELALAAGDAVAAYAYGRVAYHRGLDRLRKHGWGGSGIVRWAQPSNRGFLRGLRALLAAAAALGEDDESGRCREFLLDLDPDDGLGVAAYPDVPGPEWSPPPIP